MGKDIIAGLIESTQQIRQMKRISAIILPTTIVLTAVWKSIVGCQAIGLLM